MASTLKISDAEIIAHVRKESALMSRSQGEQATHWMRIGMSLEKSGLIDFNRIRQVLNGNLSPDDLQTVEEAAIATEMLDNMLQSGELTQGKDAARFFANRQQQGLGVGLDDNGELVYASDETKA